MKRAIVVGDSTSHGGKVVAGSASTLINGKAVARVGDQTVCPQTGHGSCPIVEGDPNWLVDGKAVALEGHKTACGAALVASQPDTGCA